MVPLKSLFAKRGFPLSLDAFKACGASYSQFGEDMIVASLFDKESPCGYYLDLGCYHPLRWSNTYHFYRRGWSGLSVDASGAFQGLWKKHRPRDIHWVYAVTPTSLHYVSDYVESEEFPATNYCQVASGNQAEFLNQNKKTKMKSLSISELSERWPFPSKPSIVTTDLEGLDFEIWKSFPFAVFEPKVLILENHDINLSESLSSHMQDNGYELYGQSGPSLIYRLRKWN